MQTQTLIIIWSVVFILGVMAVFHYKLKILEIKMLAILEVVQVQDNQITKLKKYIELANERDSLLSERTVLMNDRISKQFKMIEDMGRRSGGVYNSHNSSK